MRNKTTAAALAAAIVTVGMLPNPACATLGGPESSAQEDSQTQRGSIKATLRASYRVHEIQLPSGTVVREYAVAGGQVFAVVWQGPFIPDLRQTLGHYFDSYVSGQATSGSRTHLTIQNSDFVAHVGGHMRAFYGRAYLPQAVPAGVNIEDLT
jgi:Protein of unknown function (DUF2844)